MTPNDLTEPARLRRLMLTALDIERKTIVEGRAVRPKFLAEDGLGNVMMFLADWRDERDKGAMLAALKIAFRQKGVVRYVMISEAWMAEQKEGDERMPSERHDRVDTLWCVGIEYGNRSIALCKIAGVGKSRTVGSPEWDSFTNIEGRMAELLPERVMQ